MAIGSLAFEKDWAGLQQQRVARLQSNITDFDLQPFAVARDGNDNGVVG